MTGVTIGIDLGSHGLRVAWAGADGRVREIADLPQATDQPWITVEQSPTSGAIHFVSAKRQRSRAAIRKIIAEFAAARERVRSEAGADVARAVLTVPSWMGSRDRTALRDGAREAGLTDVHLINDSVAAVLADDDGSGGARTIVVFSLGYSGVELGLVRTARRQVRVLGHAGGVRPSGAQFDNWILNAWIAALPEREQRGLVEWTGSQWELLRSAAEAVKHRLAAGEQVTCRWPPWSMEAGDQPELVTPRPEEFDRFVCEQVETTLDRARELLAEADLTARDVDTVILVGGCTALPAVAGMLSDELGITPRATGPNHLARGAATYGAQLQPTTADLAHDPEFADPLEDEASVTPLSVPIPPAGAAAGPADAPRDGSSSDVLATARRLWSDGTPDEARKLLVGLIEQAQQLLAEIDTAAEAGPAGPATTSSETATTPEAATTPETAPTMTAEAQERARRAIQRAIRWLNRGRLSDAVSESHMAWNLAPDDQKIFDQMIDMHISAAQAAPGPSGYDAARLWLDCARKHARFNAKVIAYLVERTHAQARHHYDQGRTDEARRLLEECLDLNPDHSGARELRAEIAVEQGS